jgi:hypothetical protein
MARSAQWLITSVIVAMLLGCGPNSADVSGTVSLDGEAVADGVISFQPEKETPGPSAGGRIVDGEYEVPNVLPGTYRVEIRSWKTTDKIVNGPLGPAKERLNVIPQRYWGEATELRADFRPGSNVVDFTLKR